MVNFENSSPENQPDLVRSQWFGGLSDAGGGIGRGVDPKVAEDLGYTNPESLSLANNTPESWTEEFTNNSEVANTPTPKRGGHSDAVHKVKADKSLKLQGTIKPKETRQGLGGRALLSADEPPRHIPDARRF